MRSVRFSMPTVEMFSTAMVNNSFLPIMGSHYSIPGTFFSTTKNATLHMFNRRSEKRTDYMLTRQRDRKLLRDVILHPQPSLLPISDHNIVRSHVKLLGHFDRNQPVRRLKRSPPIDRQRRMNDLHLRQATRKQQQCSETTSGRHPQATAMLMM